MWDDHRLLERVAAALFASAGLAVAYTLLVLAARLPGFALREVSVSGGSVHTTREQLEAIAADELRGTFFTVDLERARAALEKLPWVRRAQLRRAWPLRLEVALEEHVPLARWRDVALVNTHGELFAAATSRSLPVFVGPDGSEAEMAQQYRALAEALLRIGRVPLEVRLSERRAWEVRLDDGGVLALGRQDAVARAARFAAAYARTLAPLALGAYRVDLRYPSGFAVRAPEAAWEARLHARVGNPT
jgi:cell division protein FtsQ